MNFPLLGKADKDFDNCIYNWRVGTVKWIVQNSTLLFQPCFYRLKSMDREEIKVTRVIKMPPGSLDFDYVKNPLPKHNLGEPPWSEEELKKAFFRDWEYTQETIKKHPGYAAHQSLLTI